MTGKSTSSPSKKNFQLTTILFQLNAIPAQISTIWFQTPRGKDSPCAQITQRHATLSQLNVVQIQQSLRSSQIETVSARMQSDQVLLSNNRPTRPRSHNILKLRCLVISAACPAAPEMRSITSGTTANHPSESVLLIRLRPDFSVVCGGYAGWAVNQFDMPAAIRAGLWSNLRWFRNLSTLPLS